MSQSDEGDWEIIYSTDQEYKIMIISEILKENGITSYDINKKDSNYLFGVFELYVRGIDVIKAKLLIEKSEI